MLYSDASGQALSDSELDRPVSDLQYPHSLFLGKTTDPYLLGSVLIFLCCTYLC